MPDKRLKSSFYAPNKKSPEIEFYKFETEFNNLVNGWTRSLATEIKDQDISGLTSDSKVIRELKGEFEQQTREYNQHLELATIKREADAAWNTQNFKLFIEIMNDRIADFPDSYGKKLSIAKKREKDGL